MLHALASAPVVGGGGDREAVARIIDDDAFRQLAYARAFSMANGDPAGFLDKMHLPRVRAALAKADAILALSAPIPVDGWRELRVGVRDIARRMCDAELWAGAFEQAGEPERNIWLHRAQSLYGLISPPTAPEGGSV